MLKKALKFPREVFPDDIADRRDNVPIGTVRCAAEALSIERVAPEHELPLDMNLEGSA